MRAALLLLLGLVGVAGIYGGVVMVRHPQDAFGVTPALIAGTPFDSFTWPGVLLLVLVGVVPVLVALAMLAGVPGSVALAGLFGVGLMAWIGVQWALLSQRLWLQPVVFAAGVAIVVLAVLIRRPLPG